MIGLHIALKQLNEIAIKTKLELFVSTINMLLTEPLPITGLTARISSSKNGAIIVLA
jgi:hypothetical protein